MHYHRVFKAYYTCYHQSPVPAHAVCGKMFNHLNVLDVLGTFFSFLWLVEKHDANPANTGMTGLSEPVKSVLMAAPLLSQSVAKNNISH
jgi:hypothetical protein